MHAPRNLSGNISGFNTDIFNSKRSIILGFRMLGYKIDKNAIDIPSSIVKKFQSDYNKCANNFDKWGSVNIEGNINKDTLNALEHALRLVKKKSAAESVSLSESWVSFCNNDTKKLAVNPPEVRGTNFVEVTGPKSGKLRNMHNDHSLRCNIIGFETHGDTVFAIISIPPQSGLANGRSENLTCPCTFLR